MYWIHEQIRVLLELIFLKNSLCQSQSLLLLSLLAHKSLTLLVFLYFSFVKRIIVVLLIWGHRFLLRLNLVEVISGTLKHTADNVFQRLMRGGEIRKLTLSLGTCSARQDVICDSWVAVEIFFLILFDLCFLLLNFLRVQLQTTVHIFHLNRVFVMNDRNEFLISGSYLLVYVFVIHEHRAVSESVPSVLLVQLLLNFALAVVIINRLKIV